MARSESYNTKQKNLIIDTIKKHQNEFTISDIYDELRGNVGLTTIYRLVYKLNKEGKLNKYITDTNITYYQYLEECEEDNHFYLKCLECGSLIHIDCSCIGELFNHILNIHKFKPNKEHVIINGICDNCSSKKSKSASNET